VLDAQAGRLISQLVSDPALYREPVEVVGTCTDSPTTLIGIHHGGHHRDAFRYACPRPDRTSALIDAVYSIEAAQAATDAARAAADAAKAAEEQGRSRK
jgi:hypothetical protein